MNRAAEATQAAVVVPAVATPVEKMEALAVLVAPKDPTVLLAELEDV